VGRLTQLVERGFHRSAGNDAKTVEELFGMWPGGRLGNKGCRGRGSGTWSISRIGATTATAIAPTAKPRIPHPTALPPLPKATKALVQRATEGTLAPSSQKSWGVETATGEHLQVKARVVTDPNVRGERQLSFFRSCNFDAAVIVLFDNEFRVWRGAYVAVEVLEQEARFVEHVKGFRFIATDAILDLGDDWTERLRAAAAA
jgi:hypothetical protein